MDTLIINISKAQDELKNKFRAPGNETA